MPNAEARHQLRRPDGSPVRVLLVNGETTLAELLVMALPDEGWEVRSAAVGLSAVRIARDFRPDTGVFSRTWPQPQSSSG